MEVSGHLQAPVALNPGISPWYPLERRLGRPQSWSGHSGEEKNSHHLLGLEFLTIQPIDQHYTTEISWLCSDVVGYHNLNLQCHENLSCK
jgi:predicted esterase YcpF (UPF0227 family)